MTTVSYKTFEQRCKDGVWEAQSDVSSTGMVQVYNTKNHRIMMVRVSGY